MFFFKQKKPTFIFIGHSHINALAEATKKHPELPQSSVFIHCIRNSNGEPLTYRSEDGDIHLNKNLSAKLHESIKSSRNPILFSLLGGNAHNMLSLLEHPEPFNFLMPNESGAGDIRDDQRTFLPYRQIYDVMYGRSKPFFDAFDAIQEEISIPIYHLESPPPIGCDEHITIHLDPYFKKRAEGKKLSPRELRKRLWQLHSQTFIDYCSKQDIPFIQTPQTTLDPEGFLAPQGYPDNATHGNFWYGKAVITNLVRQFHHEKLRQ